MLHFLITVTKQMFSQWKNQAGLRHAEICQRISFIYTNKIKYDEYDELHIVVDRYDIPKSHKVRTRYLRLGDSYPVAFHITNISNIPLKKLSSHTATKDELIVFVSKELPEFSKENNKLYTIAWRNKAEASQGDGMLK